MWVIAQQWLATRGVASVHDPVIRRGLESQVQTVQQSVLLSQIRNLDFRCKWACNLRKLPPLHVSNIPSNALSVIVVGVTYWRKELLIGTNWCVKLMWAISSSLKIVGTLSGYLHTIKEVPFRWGGDRYEGKSSWILCAVIFFAYINSW